MPPTASSTPSPVASGKKGGGSSSKKQRRPYPRFTEFQQEETGEIEIVRPTEKDVLLGRGNGIAKWPGNVHFRCLVNYHRDDYIRCPDMEKHRIALWVIRDVHKIGGRFLILVENGSNNNKTSENEESPTKDNSPRGDQRSYIQTSEWRQVEHGRALEKCCQALREKRRTHPLPKSPFCKKSITELVFMAPEDEQIKATLKPLDEVFFRMTVETASKPKKLKSLTDASGSKNELEAAAPAKAKTKKRPRRHSGASEPTSAVMAVLKLKRPYKRRASADALNTQDKESKRRLVVAAAKPVTVVPPMERIRSLLEEEMMKRLQAFVQKHGHCAVPPLLLSKDNVSEEDAASAEALADWCIAQRQVYREVTETGYRPATPQERACLNRLQALDFVWDYEAWHWNRQYQQLARAHSLRNQAPRKSSNDMEVEANPENSEKDLGKDANELSKEDVKTNDQNAEEKTVEKVIDGEKKPVDIATKRDNDKKKKAKYHQEADKNLSPQCRAWWLDQRTQYQQSKLVEHTERDEGLLHYHRLQRMGTLLL